MHTILLIGTILSVPGGMPLMLHTLSALDPLMHFTTSTTWNQVIQHGNIWSLINVHLTSRRLIKWVE